MALPTGSAASQGSTNPRAPGESAPGAGTTGRNAPARVFTALVLAGRRDASDPLARALGAPHRALLPIEGRPMLERVVDTLHRCRWVDRALVSIDRPELIERETRLHERIQEGFLELVPSADTPSQSVAQVLRALPPETPLLVTTADHALLVPEMLEHFLSSSEASGADVAVALVAARVLRARFPDARRTYIRLRGESYSGANLFAFRTPRAEAAATFWRRAEHFRKQPWRLARSFGIATLLLFALRRLDLSAAFARISKIVGVRIVAVPMPWAEAAVDVDTLEDFELVHQILAEAPPAQTPSPAKGCARRPPRSAG